MSRSQPTRDAALRRRLDTAMQRLAAARRTFTEEDALAEIWEAGYNVSPQDDSRLILGREADGRSPRHWHLAAADCLVFRTVGVDHEMQREETRLADAEVLASLRGGLGESYRQSVAAILSDHPAGLTFRELLAVVRDRQAHAVHRGTLRVVLHAGGFVCRDGRWQVASDDNQSRRLLREAVVRAAGGTAAGESEPASTRTRLLDVATSVAGRCRATLSELRGTLGS